MRGRDNRWSRGNKDRNWRGGHGRGRGDFGRGGNRGGHRDRSFNPRGSFSGRDGGRFDSNKKWQNKPVNDSPGLRLSEDQIGVTEYMSQHEGFNGIIKSRYSDFQVSEINLQGEVAQLTCQVPPTPPAEEQVEDDEELLLNKYNVEILPIETWDQINKVFEGTAKEPVEIDMTTSTKEERTKMHVAVKKVFGDSIIGSTVNVGDKKYVRFEKYKKGLRVDNRVKWPWPAEFVHFLVHKENCDTMEAAAKIAERLRTHIKASMIGYAGTKDRRAKTTQWFSIRKIPPARLASACAGMRELKVGNFCFRDHHLRLGMLKGNKFRIALRNVTADDAAVGAACALLSERGFINYYGLQRFGTRADVPTFEIGKKLLKGNFLGAIESILQEREGPLQAALAAYAARGAGAARALLPRGLPALEARLIAALADKPNDVYHALHWIPRNTRLLYLHSYQSLVWNRCVSERVRRHGLTPAPGDLVTLLPGDLGEESDDEESDTEESQEKTEKPVESTETSEKPETADNKKPQKKKEEKKQIPVKVVTQEDVDNKVYTIFDVVMPLPGYFIEYPPNMKEYYEKLLTDDGLTLSLKHKNKSYCLSGAYRRVAVRPAGVAWAAARYSDPYADLVLSDADLMRGAALDGLKDDGLYKAVIVSFSLPPSCYATMALRELLRADTSGENQAKQNHYHKRRLDEEGGEGGGEDDGGKKAKEDSEASEDVGGNE